MRLLGWLCLGPLTVGRTAEFSQLCCIRIDHRSDPMNIWMILCLFFSHFEHHGFSKRFLVGIAFRHGVTIGGDHEQLRDDLLHITSRKCASSENVDRDACIAVVSRYWPSRPGAGCAADTTIDRNSVTYNALSSTISAAVARGDILSRQFS